MQVASRIALAIALVLVLLFGAGLAHADEGTLSLGEARPRTCCGLASDLALHLGAAHVPVTMDIFTAPTALGPHSYLGDSPSKELNGIIYTRRGGFIDTGHSREYSDRTAKLIVSLKPLLARGSGTLHLRPRDGDIQVHVVRRVPPEDLEITTVRLAQRIAFQISVWVEITQHYGHTVIRGAEEYFSAFTPEDLYSNLLGTKMGAAAVASSLPYDRAMDAVLAHTLATLEAVPSAETRRIIGALAGRWWRAGTPWPSPGIPIARKFDIGPYVSPMLAPPDVAPPPATPFVLDVPDHDDHGAPLADFYRLEIVPDLRKVPHLVSAGSFPVVTGENLPRLVGLVRQAVEAGDDAPRSAYAPFPVETKGPLAHYLVGLRLFELKAMGGVTSTLSDSVKGAFGGSFIGVRADTRGGDFDLLRLDISHAVERGPIAGMSFYRSDAVYFCRDRETHTLRAPLLSLLGPCMPGEWIGIGGSVAEAFHDGRTGRTALRPISLYGVLNALGNGQSPSYDAVRVLLRGGGAVEHVWSVEEGGVTLPRVGAGALLLARTPRRHFEATGGAGFRVDPTTPKDTAFESHVGLRYYFLLGGNRTALLPDAVSPWGVGSIGLEGGHSYWTRPRHSFADIAAPFVSATQSGTWQMLVTATLGFEGLTY